MPNRYYDVTAWKFEGLPVPEKTIMLVPADSREDAIVGGMEMVQEDGDDPLLYERWEAKLAPINGLHDL